MKKITLIKALLLFQFSFLVLFIQNANWLADDWICWSASWVTLTEEPTGSTELCDEWGAWIVAWDWPWTRTCWDGWGSVDCMANKEMGADAPTESGDLLESWSLCPVSIAQYEDLYVKTAIYNTFYETLRSKTEDEFIWTNWSDDWLFEAWWMLEKNSSIKKIKYNDILDTLNISWNISTGSLSDETIAFNLAAKEYSNYIWKTPEADFLTHFSYNEKFNSNWFQWFLLSRMKAQVVSLIDVLQWTFAFVPIDMSAEDDWIIEGLKRDLWSLVFQPYLDFLEEERKDMIGYGIWHCYKTSAELYTYWINCDLRETCSPADYSDDSWTPASCTWNNWANELRKIIKTQARIIQLESLIENSGTGVTVDLDGLSENDALWGSLNEFISDYFNNLDDDFADVDRISEWDFERLCWDKDASQCSWDFYSVFVKHYMADAWKGYSNPLWWVVKPLSITLLNTEDILQEINIEDVLDSLFDAYWDLVILHKFNELFFDQFQRQYVTVDDSWSLIFPDWFVDILSQWISCDWEMTEAWIWSSLWTIWGNANNDMNEVTNEDFLTWIPWISEAISRDWVTSMWQVDSLFEDYEWEQVKLKFEPIQIQIDAWDDDCFAWWTNILTKWWSKMIKNLKKWDIVSCYDEKSWKNEECEVLKLIEKKVNSYYIINNNLTATSHPMYIKKASWKTWWWAIDQKNRWFWYKNIVDLIGIEVWDSFLNSEWEWIKVDSFEPKNENLDVYNLKLSNNNNFYAEWFLAHWSYRVYLDVIVDKVLNYF